MPDDNMSAEQEEEMSEEELDALYGEVDTDDDSDDDRDKADDKGNDGDDDSDDDEDDDEDEEDAGEEDDDADDDDAEEEDEEEEDDVDPLSAVKAQAAALKQKEQSDAEEQLAKSERAEKMSTAREEILKELFGQDKVKIGEKEVDLKELSAEYGEDLDTLITARAYQIAEPLVAKAMEAGGYASKADMDAIRAENNELRLLSEVAQDHPDVYKLRADDKFWDWTDKQGDDVAALLREGSAKSISTILSAYKKASITKTNEKIDKESSERKKKHTSIHSSTVRSKATKKSGKSTKTSRMSAEEEAATFDEIEVTD